MSLTATAPDGRPLFKGRVPDASAAGAAALPATGGSASFDVPPGQVQLRLVVEGARGEVIDSAARELTAPDFTRCRSRSARRASITRRTAREMQALKANPDAVPAADREFSRTERMLVRVDAYAPGGVTPTVTARLLNRGGT